MVILKLFASVSGRILSLWGHRNYIGMAHTIYRLVLIALAVQMGLRMLNRHIRLHPRLW